MAPLSPSASIEQRNEEIKEAVYISPVFISDNGDLEIKSVKPNAQAVILPNQPDSSEDSDSDLSDEDYEDDNSQADIVENGVAADKTCVAVPKKQKRPWWKKYQGILLAILSSLIFSFSGLLVKKLETYDPLNSALYKFQGALLPAIPLLIGKRYFSKKGHQVVERVWPLTEVKKVKAIGLVLLRSFLACNALLLHYYSLKYLPLGDALTIASASPLFVAILARLFLGEKCGYATIIASVFSMVGVVAIAKPPVLTGSDGMNTDILFGSGLALACTFVTAVSFIVLRYIRKVHYSVTTLMYGSWGTIECLALVLMIPGLKIPSGGVEWLLIIALAALTLFGQFAIILAMKAERAGPVAIVRTMDVFFGYIFEILLYSVPDLLSLSGASIILLSVLYVGLRKWVRSYPKDHPLRRRLWLIAV